MGLESFKLDGNDPVKLNQKLGPIVDNIRETSRPSFIECDTYRWREHCGPNFDDDLNYRDKVEIEAWKARDPIEKLTSDLGLTQHEVKVLKESIDIEVKQAFDFAEKSPFPEEHEAYTGEYAAQ